ncbi:MAG: 16S rRNA (cytosine(1402)-N(4))-methyltransferase RsmH [Candidatus Dormibacteria bacterium]
MERPTPTVAGMGTAPNDATPGALAPDAPGHRPVLLHPLIESLQPKPGDLAVDATLGGGGVTGALLERVGPGGRVVAIDRDAAAIERARSQFGDARSALTLVHDDFANIGTIIERLGIDAVDVVAFDLGISSLQWDDAARGFSFNRDGPLDMRLDRTSGQTAAELIASASEDELRDILRELGEERFSQRIARRIVETRARHPIETTQQLREMVEKTIARRFWPKRIHPATRTFQALRIAVNGELHSLERGLQASIHILRPGGRLGVISFHSLEDTLVKTTLHVAATSCLCPPQQPHCTCAHRATLSLVTQRVIRPDSAEIGANPRARSARLRVAQKLDLAG